MNTRNPSMDENKKRALAAALGQIEKQFGKGSVMRMGDRAVEAVEIVGTGSLMLDIALGIGGLPRGRVVEIYGPESSGKTTLTLQAIAECQKKGGTAAFIDAEHALDPIYAAKLGVNVDDLLLSQPDTGEQALEIADMLVRSNAVDMVVVDSVAALTRKAEIEGEMGDQLPGLQARQLVAHLAFDFRLRRERGDRVDHHHVDRVRTHQHVGDLERLLAGVRLREQQVVDVDAELGGID